MRLEIPETRVPTILVGSGTMLYLLYPGWSFPSVWMSGSCRVQSDSCVPLWFAADLCELKSTFFDFSDLNISKSQSCFWSLHRINSHDKPWHWGAQLPLGDLRQILCRHQYLAATPKQLLLCSTTTLVLDVPAGVAACHVLVGM